MNNLQIEIEEAVLIFKENGVLYVNFKPKTSIDLPQAQAVVEKTKLLVQSRKHCNIVDTKDVIFMTDAARKYFASQRDKNLLGVAIISKSKVQKTLANFYLQFAKPQVITKLFYTTEEAEKWVTEIFEKEKNKE